MRFGHLMMAWRSENDEAAMTEIVNNYIRPIIVGMQHRYQFRLHDEEQVLHDAVVHITMRLDRVSARKNWFGYLSTCAMNYLREAWSCQTTKERGKERHLERVKDSARRNAGLCHQTTHPWSDDDAR